MQETPMLFPVTPTEFWKQIKMLMEEVVEQKLNHSSQKQLSQLYRQEKPLLKVAEVCEIFQISKPTLYEWMKEDKLKSFKVKSRRYFLRADIEAMIGQTQSVTS